VSEINTNPTTKQEATRMAKMADRWKANCYRFDYDRGAYKLTKRGTHFTLAERAALEEMLQRHGWRLAPEDALNGETCWKGGLGRLDEGAWSTQRACAQLFSAIARSM
jgi:hypothetical protein